MSHFEAVIGLEVHVQLGTKSKLFCSCPTTFGTPPNTNICEICAGMPGALPSLNKLAVEYAVKAGLALHCTINTHSFFSRKNYFYPDLPNGYQISQGTHALCTSGYLDLTIKNNNKRIGIHQIHLENDAGKSIHSPHENKSFIDLNRAGVPLIEIVSKPDINTPSEAVAYLKSLHAIVTYLGISDGNMEEGNFRCDANISLRPYNSKHLGTRTEIKNLNSFRNVQRALEFEINRQQDILEDGKTIIQETRLYNSDKDITTPMRDKETAHDYRYFPDPDLVPIYVAAQEIEKWKGEIPELSDSRQKRFVIEWGLAHQDAEILTSSRELADFFEKAVKLYPQPKKIANLITILLLHMLNEHNITIQQCTMKPEAIAELATIIDEGLISIKIAHDIFEELFSKQLMPKDYVIKHGLTQISDTKTIDTIVVEVLAENPAEVAAYKNGKTKLLSFFMGQVMKKMQGQANPSLVNQALHNILSK